MITRPSSHHPVALHAAAFATQGWSLSLPHSSSVSSRPKTNVALQSVLISTCFEAMTGAAITVQALNTDRMMGAAADRGLIAGVQRP
jgi:hypothetical protein